MIRFALLTWLIVGASTAGAQSLPERFMIDGVAADDVLNIRAMPDASSDIVGSFNPFDLNVEVLDQQDGWGRVGTGEGSGWVSMRFLAPNPVPANDIPRPLSCFGTEPFWGMAMYPRGAEYTEMGQDRRVLNLLRERAATNGYLIEAREGPTLTRTLIVTALSCSDGMSDRMFGMSATLFTDTPDGSYVQTGCCTMQVN